MSETGETYVLHPEFVFREEEDGAFLFNPRTNALHCLNKVGATICRMCDGKDNLEAICRRLYDDFDVDVKPEDLKKDVEAFLGRMMDLNLLQPRT
jgi:PqqD family protein of HPr-rel-A system